MPPGPEGRSLASHHIHLTSTDAFDRAATAAAPTPGLRLAGTGTRRTLGKKLESVGVSTRRCRTSDGSGVGLEGVRTLTTRLLAARTQARTSSGRTEEFCDAKLAFSDLRP